jgi:hypothetical protein
VQARGLGHDTATSSVEAVGSGVGRTCHVEPFQISENVAPTAMHARTVGHETSWNPLPVALTAVGWISQLAPFHRSARGEPPLKPTAVHARGVAHETLSNWSALVPTGLGVRRIRQVEPFQESAKVK